MCLRSASDAPSASRIWRPGGLFMCLRYVADLALVIHQGQHSVALRVLAQLVREVEQPGRVAGGVERLVERRVRDRQLHGEGTAVLIGSGLGNRPPLGGQLRQLREGAVYASQPCIVTTLDRPLEGDTVEQLKHVVDLNQVLL